MEFEESYIERGCETERSTPTLILSQVKEKLRRQSEKILHLESYKSLCESRIRQLLPNHPLPVQKDHLFHLKILPLDKQLSGIENTQNFPSDFQKFPQGGFCSKDTSKDLTQKLNALIKEKKEIEESLRNEIQVCEEQRGYIEVLKQAIQINMESLRIKGVSVDDFANFASVKIKCDEYYKELLRTGMKNKENECKNGLLIEELEEKETDFKVLWQRFESVLKECEELKRKLKDINEKYEGLDKENIRMSQLVKESAALKSENEALMKEYTGVKESNSKLSLRVKEMEKDFKEKLSELNKVLEEGSNEDKCRVYEAEIERLRASVEELKEIVSKTTAKYTEVDLKMKRKVYKYKEEHSQMTYRNKETERKAQILVAENEKLRSLNDLLNQQTSRPLDAKQTPLEDSLNYQELYEESYSEAIKLLYVFADFLVENSDKIDITGKSLTRLLQDLSKDFELLKKRFKSLKLLADSTNSTQRSSLISLEAAQHEVKQLKSQDFSKSCKIESLLIENSHLKESLKSQISSLQQEILILRDSLKSSAQSYEKALEQNNKLSSEISQFKYKLSSNEATISALEEQQKLTQHSKTHLTSLIRRIQSLSDSPQFRATINEVLRIQSELEVSYLEKLRVCIQLRKLDGINDKEFHESLRRQLEDCEGCIGKYLLKIKELEDELGGENEASS